MQRTAVTTGFSLAIVAWVAITAGWPGPRWRYWERSLEDQLLALRGPRRPPAAVVVVPIDDATLQQGQWFEGQVTIPPWARGIGTLPWPRRAYGLLADRLLAAGAAAVAINVVFEGPSRYGPADDAALAAVLRRWPGRIALATEMLEASDGQGAAILTLVRPEGLLPALGGPGALGLTNILAPTPTRPALHPDTYGRTLLPAQGLAAQPSLVTTLLRLAGRQSRQPDARRAIHAYGPEGTLPRLPAWEVLDPQRWARHPRRGDLAGALVLVGPTVAQGTAGYVSPFGALSGLELLATATANSLQGDGLAPWPETASARALLAAAPLVVLAGLALRCATLQGRLLGLGLGLALQLAAAGLALVGFQRWLPLLPPVAGLGLLGLLYGGDAYLAEERERRRLRRTFERYVAPSVVAEILADPQAAQGILRGRVLEVTVLFSDLKGFTQLTRQRSAAGQSELHVHQLNTYLGAMVAVINAHGGTVDKFIGDAVMAVFGSPVGRGRRQEALAAVRCALAMGAALEQLNVRWQAEGLEPLACGIGLASGPVLAGQIGSPQRLEFTVIGDTVNLASRLEGLTRRLPAAVVVDAATAALVAQGDGAGGDPTAAPSGPLCITPLGLQAIKGLGEQEVFAVAAAGHGATAMDCGG